MKSRSRIEKLPPGQIEYIRRWLFIEKISYDECIARCKSQFSLVLGKTALCEWYAKQEKQQLADRALQAVLGKARESATTATAIVQAAQELKEPWWEATMQQIGQEAFERKLHGEEMEIADLKTLMDIVAVKLNVNLERKKVEQKDQSLAQTDRKIKLLEAKMQSAKAEVKKLREKGAAINDAERTAILDKVDEILGIK